VLARDLIPAYYCTHDRFSELSRAEKESQRKKARGLLDLSPEKTVVAFLGKLIPRKDPGLLLEAVEHMPPDLRDRIAFCLSVPASWKASCRNVQTSFEKPWISQWSSRDLLIRWSSRITNLSADITVLPSYKNETWGLVVNEALQAGCSVVISDKW